MHHLRKCACAFLLVLAITSGNADAGNSIERDKPITSSTIRDVRAVLMPFVSCGIVAGEGSRKIGDLSNKAIDKIIYGGGLSFSYHPRKEYSVGVNVERFYKPLPEGFETIRGWIVSGSFMLYSGRHCKAIPCARADVGFVSGTFPDSAGVTDLKLGTHLYIKLGLGILTLRTSGIHSKFEIYYSRAFSSEHKLEQLGDAEIGFDGQRVGLELGIGFSVLSPR